MITANSHLTAIHRRGPSAPLRFLERTGYIQGCTIDWGCGRGADVDYLREHHTDFVAAYDPHYSPELPNPAARFKTILCTYVLNTIPNYHDRCVIIEEALEYLTPGGWLLVTVRARQSDLNGWTERGTWQGYVGDQLEVGGFQRLCRNQDYEIWGWQLPTE